MHTMTTAEIKAKVHEAVRAGDRAKVQSLTAEIMRRLNEAGRPYTGLTSDPAKLAALRAQREAILNGEI